MFQNVYAVSHMDYKTAKRVAPFPLATVETIANSALSRPVLCRTIQEALSIFYATRESRPRQVYVVCMSSGWADYARIQVIDFPDRPEFQKVKLEATQATRIQTANLDEYIIRLEIDAIQKNQVLSFFNTYIMSVSKARRDDASRVFLKWLTGEADVNWLSRALFETSAKTALMDFVNSEIGETYGKLFPALLADTDQAMDHPFPAFEIEYFRRLNVKLNEG